MSDPADSGVRHFLADDDLSPVEQTQVLDLADQIRAEPWTHRPFAGPRSVAMLFDKPSTRTRITFEAGIAELGGHPLVMETGSSQLGRGESIADTARVLGRHVAAVVWRTGAQERIVEMAAHSGVPVINALTDDYHPCQILADWQAVRARKGRLAGLRFAYLGDGANNMAHSYLLGGALAGMHVRIGAPEGFHPRADILQRAQAIARSTGGSVLVTDAASEAAREADVVATDTWVSMGFEGTQVSPVETFGAYAVTQQLMRGADPEAVVLHCLPAYRGKEIDAEVIDGPASLVWEEVENRRHAQKAILVFCAERSGGVGAD